MILKFVVNTAECIVHAHPQDSLRTCVDIAFTCTRYNRNHSFGSPHDGESMGWIVRDREGHLLDEDVEVSTLDYTADRIFVQLPVGANA